MGCPGSDRPVSSILFNLLGNDAEDVEDFLDSCNEQEMRIISKHRDDPHVLKKVILRIRGDIDETAKALAMEE